MTDSKPLTGAGLDCALGVALVAQDSEPKRKTSTDPIEAELIGSNECRARDRARGITVRSGSPVLAMCRALVGAGYDPGRPLQVYRGKTLALTVRRIGDGPRLRVSSSGVGFCWDGAED